MTTHPEPSPVSDAEPVSDPWSLLGGARVVWAQVLHERSELSDARRDVSEALHQSGCADGPIADVTLAMTELAVNALTHGDAATVDISVAVWSESSAVLLVVRHEDRGPLVLTEPPQMATPEDLHGRGRAIVASIADEFDTIRHPNGEVEHGARFTS